MITEITPNVVEIAPGESCTLAVHVSNTTATIDAYEISVFGMDPNWVTVAPSRLSLFPSESGDVEITLTLPPSFPAGHRQLSVHVRSENDPASFALTPLALIALGQPRLSVRLDPVVITGGSEATFGLVVSNDGNTVVQAVASATDPEEKLDIRVTPAVIELLPGHREVVQTTVGGDRPWFGQPKVRMITFAVDATTRTETMGTFVQKPRISRWLISIMGLLAAAAIFAAVLSRTFDNVVDEASVDKGLLSEALDKGDEGGLTTPVNPAVVKGSVLLFSTKEGVAGVQAELFSTGNTKVPLATAATSDGGAFTFGRLNSGTYKILFSGAGFTPTWYQSGATAADAAEVEVELGKTLELDPVELGGRPGGVQGTVEADDLTNIKATLVVPGTITDATTAQVQAVDVSADGTFAFENVPSPADYQLVVQKAGYATETRDVKVGPAQQVENIQIVMRKGDGLVTGRIADATGALGGAVIEATDGTTKISTVSLTEGDTGAFALRALSTPQVYTITASAEGYTTETLTVTLTSGQTFDAGTIQLAKATGSVGGTVSQQDVGPIGGVAVTVSTGDTTYTTFTASTGNVGQYYLDQLPIPATYTITFAKPGLVSQVRVQDLDPANNTADTSAIDVALLRDVATVRGVVRGLDGAPIVGATVVLSDGTNVRTLVTADEPLGRFSFSNVAPGAYTVTASLPGASQEVQLVNVVADRDEEMNIRLQSQASATGQVLLLDAATGTYQPYVGASVRLFLPDAFPSGTPVAVTVTDLNGSYTFSALNAPQNYVIAVYQTPASPEALDSRLILTQPSTQLTVPTINIPLLF